MFVHTPEIPMVDISVIFDAGSRRDQNLPGLANLTSDMLDQGTTQLNADAIATRFDQLGAILSINTSQDMTSVSLRSLSDTHLLTPAVELFTTLLTQANFPKEAFQREQQNTLTAIQAIGQSPEAIATKAFLQTTYDNYPYGHLAIGTTKSITQLTPQHLINFSKQYYVANNALIAIVGDLDHPAAVNLAEQIVSRLPAGQKAASLPDATPPKPQSVSIPYPSSQSYIRIGGLGISRSSPELFPMFLGTYILGGGMTSRLFASVREQYGLTYSIGSYFLPLSNRGPFVVSLQTRNTMTPEALKVTREVLQNYHAKGPTAEELVTAKQYLTGNFPLRLASNGDIMSAIISIGFYHLPYDYLDTFTQKIQAVTISQVNEAIQNNIVPNQMVSVIVGAGTSPPKINKAAPYRGAISVHLSFYGLL